MPSATTPPSQTPAHAVGAPFPSAGAAARHASGVAYAIAGYVLWGLLPLYWKALSFMPADQIVAHRLVWSLLFFLMIIGIKQRWRHLAPLFAKPRLIAVHLLSGLVLTGNWVVYIWAVNAGFVVETSLGYFINPLISVLLGVVLLGESLRRGQWLAVAVAASGLLFLTFVYGELPWIGLLLALTFGAYGLIKKLSPVDAVTGLMLEALLLLPFAAGWLLLLEQSGVGMLARLDPLQWGWVVLAGVATGTPLLLFTTAAQRIPLSLLGILQYIAPSLQFLLGVWVYQEPFNAARLLGFSLVWLALVIYTSDSLMARRRLQRQLAPAAILAEAGVSQGDAPRQGADQQQ